MAFSLDKQYLHPTNFNEGTDTMGPYQRKICVRITGTSDDATNAADTQVIDKSDLLGPDGAEPSKLVVEEVEWSVAGYDAVVLQWDDSTDEEMFRLSGAGFKDYVPYGGLHPAASGNTGDILVTTEGAAANSAFDITLVFRLKK